MILCDAGPLVALIDADDPYHQQCVKIAASLEPRMVTTWPCLTEAMHFLYRAGGINAQNELWAFIAKGVLQIYLPMAGEWQRLHALMTQYADMPLDLADASLVSAAERLQSYPLFSFDNSLRAIRMDGRNSFDFVS